jgi:phosphinothricin acetyltransferase
MTRIRPARHSDSPQIAALLNPILRDTTVTFSSIEKSPEDIDAVIAKQADQGHPYLVSHKADRITGIASYTPFRNGPGYSRTMEHTVYVDPDSFGLGIGRALMAALEAHAHLSGVTTLIGGISAENTAGIVFHTKLGFVLCGHLPGIGHKFGRDLDLLLMQKSLVTPRRSSP